jgi:hypothetical protein
MRQQVPCGDEGKMSRFEPRLEELERQLDAARRDIALIEVSLSSANRRINATVDLYEQRIDLIYRQVVAELGRALGSGTIKIETETEVDCRLARMLSAGLRTPMDPLRIDLNNIVSEELTPGTLNAPLTIYGFRLNRSRAREFGDCIEIMPANKTSPGTAVYGPYKRLKPGSYVVTAELRATGIRDAASAGGDVALDVFSPATGNILADERIASRALRPEMRLSVNFDWTFECAHDAIEFRLHQRSNATISLTAILLKESGAVAM